MIVPPFHRLIIAALLLIAGFAALPVRAQDVPTAEVQEAVIKEAMITINDANVTANYDVLHAKLSRGFQGETSPEALSEMFQPFRENKIFWWAVAGMDPIADTPTVVENGVLKLRGHFPTEGLEVSYRLDMILEDAKWRLIAFNVGANPPS